MRIPDEALKEFEALLRKDYPDEKFTQKQILDAATRVMRAVELVSLPIPPKKIKNFNQTEE